MVRSLLIGSMLALSYGCTKSPSAHDAAPTMRVLAAVGDLDAPTTARLLYQGCSEISSCASGCEKELTFCAGPDTDPAQRAAVLSSCSGLDYRARRDKGEQLDPDAWIRQHFSGFLDALTPVAGEADKQKLSELRAQTKL